jgi:hypothetical protein
MRSESERQAIAALYAISVNWFVPRNHDYSDKSEKVPKSKYGPGKAVTKFVPSRRGGAGEKGDS